MCSKEESTSADTQVDNILLQSHRVLFNLYEVIKTENEKQKAVLTNLSKVYSEISRSGSKTRESIVKGEVQTTSPNGNMSEGLIPEIQESEELLKRCEQIKKQFQSLNNVPKKCPNTKKQISGDQMEILKYSSHKQNVKNGTGTNKRFSGSKKPVGKNSRMPEYGIITRQELKEITGRNMKQTSLSSHNKMSTESEKLAQSLSPLLERNKLLKSEIMPYLNGCCENSRLFLQHHGKNICEDCAQCQLKESKKNYVSEITAHNPRDAKSDIQLSQIHSLIHSHLEENVIPVLKKFRENEIPVQLIQCLLALGLSKEDLFV